MQSFLSENVKVSVFKEINALKGMYSNLYMFFIFMMFSTKKYNSQFILLFSDKF